MKNDVSHMPITNATMAYKMSSNPDIDINGNAGLAAEAGKMSLEISPVTSAESEGTGLGIVDKSGERLQVESEKDDVIGDDNDIEEQRGGEMVLGVGSKQYSQQSFDVDVDYDVIDRSDPDIKKNAIGLFTMLCLGSLDKNAPEVRALRKMRRVFNEHAIEDCNFSDLLRALHVYAGLARRRHSKKTKEKGEEKKKGSKVVEAGRVREQASLQELQFFDHMLLHSEAIYGLFLNVLSSLRASLFGVTDERIVRDRLRLEQSDFVIKRFESSAFCPAHYIAVDNTISSIVVCVRGTANFADSLTDMAATIDPLQVRQSREDFRFIQGYGHAGIVRSARNVMRSFQDDLLKALTEYPTYGIVLTGHSLGGAVAAVVSMLLRADDRFPLSKAVCFGSPPCVSMNVAEACEESVINVVNGSDLVPRVSIPVLIRFFATCRHIKDQKRWRKVLIDLGFRNLALKWDTLIQSTDEYVNTHLAHHEKTRLFVPGRLFQMSRMPKSHTDVPPGSPKKKVSTCRVDRIERQDLMRPQYGLTWRVLMSHAPLLYRRNIRSALKAAGLTPLKKPRRTLVDSIFGSSKKGDLGIRTGSGGFLQRLGRSLPNPRLSHALDDVLKKSRSAGI